MSSHPPEPETAGLGFELPTRATLWRHRTSLIAIVVLAPFAACVQGLVSAPTYVSRASVLVKLGREFQAPAAGGRTASMYRLNEALNSEIEILSSRQLAGEVLAQLGIGTLYPDIADGVDLEATSIPEAGAATNGSGAADVVRAKATLAFKKALDVVAVAESSVMDIAFAHHDPTTAKRALETLVERFQKRHVDVFGSGGQPMAERQAKEARVILDGIEGERAAYRRDNGIFDEGEQRALLLRRRDGLETARRQLRPRIEQLRSGDATQPTLATGSESPGELAVHDELMRLRSEERRLLENYFDESRSVTALRDQIRSQEELLLQVRSGSAKSLADQLAAVEAEIADLDQALQVLGSHEQPLRELDRRVAQAEAQHAAALATLSAARIDAELDGALVSSIRVIDRPSLPIEPLGLGVVARTAFGFVAGVVLAAAALMLLQFNDSRKRLEVERDVV